MDLLLGRHGAPRRPPPIHCDKEELREDLREEDRASRALLADGGVPTHDHEPTNFDILTCPGLKADIIDYWSFDCPKAGRTILRRQLRRWEQFRAYQRCIRERFPRSEEFQQHILDVKAYLRRHGIDDQINLHNPRGLQNAYDDWKEFQFYELRQADALQDAKFDRGRELDQAEQEIVNSIANRKPREHCNRMMGGVENNRRRVENAEREITRHKVLRRWIEQQFPAIRARVPLKDRVASRQAAEAAASAFRSALASSSSSATLRSDSASSSRAQKLPTFDNGTPRFPTDATAPYEPRYLKYGHIEMPDLGMLVHLYGKDGKGGTSWVTASSKNNASPSSSKTASGGNGKAPAMDAGSPSTVATSVGSASPAQIHATTNGKHTQPPPVSPSRKRKTSATGADERVRSKAKRTRERDAKTTTTESSDGYGPRMHSPWTSGSSPLPPFPLPPSPPSIVSDVPRLAQPAIGLSLGLQQSQQHRKPPPRPHTVASMLHHSPSEAISPGTSSPGSAQLPRFSDTFANAHVPRAHNSTLPRLVTSDEALHAGPSFRAINGSERRPYELFPRRPQHRQEYSRQIHQNQQHQHDSQRQPPQQCTHDGQHQYNSQPGYSYPHQQQHMQRSDQNGRPTSSSSASTSATKFSKYPNIMNMEEPSAAVSPSAAASRATAPPHMTPLARIAEAPSPSSSSSSSSAFAQGDYTTGIMSPSLPPLAAKPSADQQQQHLPSTSLVAPLSMPTTTPGGDQHRYTTIRPLAESPLPVVEAKEQSSKSSPKRRTDPASHANTNNPARVHRPIRTRRGGGKSKGKVVDLDNMMSPLMEHRQFQQTLGQQQLDEGATRLHFTTDGRERPTMGEDGYGATGGENEAGDESEEGDMVNPAVDGEGDVAMTTSFPSPSFSKPSLGTNPAIDGLGHQDINGRNEGRGSLGYDDEDERKDSAAVMSTASTTAAAAPFGHVANKGTGAPFVHVAQFRDENEDAAV